MLLLCCHTSSSVPSYAFEMQRCLTPGYLHYEQFSPRHGRKSQHPTHFAVFNQASIANWCVPTASKSVGKKKYMKSFGNWIIRKEIIFTPSTRAELSHSVAARKTISWFDNSQSISDSLLNIEEIKLRWIFFFTTLGNIKKGVYSLHSGILNKAAENDAIAKQAPNVNSLTLQRKLKRCGLFIRKDSQLCLWSWYSISV